MPYVAYLSTVSGGGYTGCFVTSVVGGGDEYGAIGNTRGPDTERVRHLRRHAKYLSAKDLKQRWLMVTGTLLNWTAPLFVIAALALVRVLLGPVCPTPSGRTRSWRWGFSRPSRRSFMA